MQTSYTQSAQTSSATGTQQSSTSITAGSVSTAAAAAVAAASQLAHQHPGVGVQQQYYHPQQVHYQYNPQFVQMPHDTNSSTATSTNGSMKAGQTMMVTNGGYTGAVYTPYPYQTIMTPQGPMYAVNSTSQPGLNPVSTTTTITHLQPVAGSTGSKRKSSGGATGEGATRGSARAKAAQETTDVHSAANTPRAANGVAGVAGASVSVSNTVGSHAQLRRHKHKEVEVRRRRKIASLFADLATSLECGPTDKASILSIATRFVRYAKERGILPTSVEATAGDESEDDNSNTAAQSATPSAGAAAQQQAALALQQSQQQYYLPVMNPQQYLPGIPGMMPGMGGMMFAPMPQPTAVAGTVQTATQPVTNGVPSPTNVVTPLSSPPPTETPAAATEAPKTETPAATTA